MLSHEALSHAVLGAAFEVHTLLGPGLLESAYEVCLCYELVKRRIAFERQVRVSLKYKDLKLDSGYRLDILVDRQIAIEVKAVEEVLSIHEAQLITYLKLGPFPVGLLINFNVRSLKDGILRRVV
jgi:GxxExxY protein